MSSSHVHLAHPGSPAFTATIVAVVMSSITSCAPDEGPPDVTAEPSATVERSAEAAALDDFVEKGFVQRSAQSNAEIYSAVKGEHNVVMRPIDTHFCALTRVSGEMRLESSVVGVHHSNDDISYGPGVPGYEDDGTMWKIAAYNASSNSLAANAVCVPLSDFIVDPGMAVWISPAFRHAFVTAVTEKATTNMWLGDAVSALNLVRGSFEGGGEYAHITDGQANTPTTLTSRSQTGKGIMDGWGYSLFVGHPGRTVTRRTAEYKSSGNKTTPMIPTDRGFCYLHRFSGDFNGSEERVRIYPKIESDGQEYWIFETHAGRGSASGTAQCVYYYQSELGLCDYYFCG